MNPEDGGDKNSMKAMSFPAHINQIVGISKGLNVLTFIEV